MYIERLASQIKNDVVSGLRGYHQNLSMNMKQLQDEVVSCRLQVLYEYFLKGIFPIKDLLMAINCIETDCESLERCKCVENIQTTNVLHFQIPQIISYYGKDAISYVGSPDRMNSFNVVTSLSELQLIKYRKRGANKPYVWIDLAPNSNGMLDCFLFNAPFISTVSVVGAFKDPRDLNNYECCVEDSDLNDSFIDQIVKDKLTKEKLQYYRQYKGILIPNDQQYTTGS